MVRGLGARVKRLREVHGWTIAELARRTGFSAGKLRRLESTPGTNYSRGKWWSAQVNTLALALGVTPEMLRGQGVAEGAVFAARAPTETEMQRAVRVLTAENDKLRKKRGSAEGELLKWATEEKLEIGYENGVYLVFEEHENVVGEGPTIGAALRAARASQPPLVEGG